VAGEIGHLPLADQGLTCTCGRIDCVETIASSDAIVHAVRTATGRHDLDMDAIVELAHAGQPDAVAAFDGAATAIGRAIAVVANLTGPEVAVIEGESVADSTCTKRPCARRSPPRRSAPPPVPARTAPAHVRRLGPRRRGLGHPLLRPPRRAVVPLTPPPSPSGDDLGVSVE